MSAPPYLALETAAQFVGEQLQLAGLPRPQLGLVLGSGLGHLADEIEQPLRLPYREIPGMPVPGVVGHAAELVIGRLGGTVVGCLSGRVHLYEGHAAEQVVFGVRLLALLGVQAVLLTNAAGGIAPQSVPGSLLAIDDHLNLTGHTPLLGPNDDRLGTRFPDMTEAYDRRLVALCEALGAELNVPLSRGVYAGLLGPSYETPAEIRMLELLGASAVGMSTVLEVLALRHMQVPVAALSCITNLAAGKGTELLRHEDVAQVAARVRAQFARLVVAFASRAPDVLAS